MAVDYRAGGKRISAIERLKQLDDVFHPEDILQMPDVKSLDQARVMANRWHRYGLSEPAGPRAGLHYNLYRIGPRAEEGERPVEKAVARLFDRAIVVGETALHRHDVADNAPSEMTVAVPMSECGSLRQLDYVNLVGRTQRWFDAVEQHSRVVDRLDHLLPTLDMPYALADMVRFGRDPGDVESPTQVEIDLRLAERDPSTVLHDIDQAMRGLRVDADERREFLELLETDAFLDTREAGMKV